MVHANTRTGLFVHIIAKSNMLISIVTLCSIAELSNQSRNIEKNYFETLPPVDTLSHQYGELLNGCRFDLKRLSSRELHKLFYVAHDVAFYANNEDSILLLESVFNEKILRKENVSRLAKKVQARYFDARYFEKARKLQQRFSLTKKVPEVVKANKGSTKLVLKYQGGKLHEMPFSYTKDEQIIVIVSSGCSSSNKFEQALINNQEIKEKYSEAILLMPQVNSIHYNEKHLIVNKQSEWPEIPKWETPSFYHFKDGKLIEKYSGFPINDE